MKEAMLLADNAPSCQKGIAGHLAVLENPAGFDRLVAPVIKSQVSFAGGRILPTNPDDRRKPVRRRGPSRYAAEG
jgi:hypothetical protein